MSLKKQLISEGLQYIVNKFTQNPKKHLVQGLANFVPKDLKIFRPFDL